jgi:hypothetical protein
MYGARIGTTCVGCRVATQKNCDETSELRIDDVLRFIGGGLWWPFRAGRGEQGYRCGKNHALVRAHVDGHEKPTINDANLPDGGDSCRITQRVRSCFRGTREQEF